MSRDPKPAAFESPYVSMRNNPILYNDVKGDTIRTSFRTGFLGIFGKKETVDYSNGKYYNKGTNTEYTGKVPNFQKEVLRSLTDINNNAAVGGMINYLVNSDKVLNIKEGASSQNGGAEFTLKKNKNNNNYNYTVGVDPSVGSTLIDGVGQGNIDLQTNLNISLVHELGHAEDAIRTGIWNFTTTWYTSNIDNRKVLNSEILATHRENLYRASLGLTLREWYSPEYIISPTTNNGRILSPSSRENFETTVINRGLDINRSFIPFNY